MSIRLSLAGAFLAICLSGAGAQSILFSSDETRVTEGFSFLPYGFSSESFGLGLGLAGGYAGWPAEETSYFGATTLGTSGSYNLIFSGVDLPVPGTRRWYLEPLVILGRYQDQFIYAGRMNPGFEGQRAGANDSDPENRVVATQWDNQVQMKIRYLMPIGNGTDPDEIVSRYVVREGKLITPPTGATSWNPFVSGRTHLELTPKWREQTLEKEGLNAPFRTVNLTTSLEWDNRDFEFNPSRGSHQRMSYTKDFDGNDQFGGWEFWETEVTKLISLGATQTLRQQILAFSAKVAYVPTWETQDINGSTIVTKRPPPFEGASLGGLYFMRGFDDNRFQDKASVYYSAEYRIIPEWQPLKKIEALAWADISYWQWVLFLEAGQVAPHLNLDALHSDLKMDGGFGLRGMLHAVVCRLDFAFSEEGMRITAMAGHPF